jgi:hypothetical protein
VIGLGKVVARMRLKGQHAAGHATLLGLAFEQRQHGLMAPVYAIEVANGQGAGGMEPGVIKASKYLHGLLSF